MKVSVSQIERGLLQYIDEEFVQKMEGLTKWLIIGAVEVGTAKAQHIANTIVHHPMVKAVDLVDENGMIDLDMLYEAMMRAANKTGAVVQNFPLIGAVTFTHDDIEKLRNRIMQA